MTLTRTLKINKHHELTQVIIKLHLTVVPYKIMSFNLKPKINEKSSRHVAMFSPKKSRRMRWRSVDVTCWWQSVVFFGVFVIRKSTTVIWNMTSSWLDQKNYVLNCFVNSANVTVQCGNLPFWYTKRSLITSIIRRGFVQQNLSGTDGYGNYFTQTDGYKKAVFMLYGAQVWLSQ